MDLKFPVSSELQNSNTSFWNIEVSECPTKTDETTKNLFMINLLPPVVYGSCAVLESWVDYLCS